MTPTPYYDIQSRRLPAPTRPKRIRMAIDFTEAFATFYRESMELGTESLSDDRDIERLTTFTPEELLQGALDVVEDMICRGNMDTGIGYQDIARLQYHDDIREIMYNDIVRRIHPHALIDRTMQYVIDLLKDSLSRTVCQLFQWHPDYRPPASAKDPIIYRVLMHLVIKLANAMVYVGKEFQLTAYELINYHRFSYQATSYSDYCYVLTLDGI